MSAQQSDALVFFGATGDLAHKKIFPSLQATVKRGHLEVPLIGVAKAGWNLEQFYDQTGTIRDVVQNHLFQVLCNMAMEPPVRADSESIRDEKVKVLKAMRTLAAEDLVRGQFRGYLGEPGVAADSQVETFAALRLEIDSWRWRGVPFYIRAGKNLPVTCTEILVRLRQVPTMYPQAAITPNHFRFRVSPQIVGAFGMNAIAPDSAAGVEQIELSFQPAAGRRGAASRGASFWRGCRTRSRRRRPGPRGPHSRFRYRSDRFRPPTGRRQ